MFCDGIVCVMKAYKVPYSDHQSKRQAFVALRIAGVLCCINKCLPWLKGIENLS